MNSIATETKRGGQIMHEIHLGCFAEHGRREWSVPWFGQDPEKAACKQIVFQEVFLPAIIRVRDGMLISCLCKLISLGKAWMSGVRLLAVPRRLGAAGARAREEAERSTRPPALQRGCINQLGAGALLSPFICF